MKLPKLTLDQVHIGQIVKAAHRTLDIEDNPYRWGHEKYIIWKAAHMYPVHICNAPSLILMWDTFKTHREHWNIL